MKTPLKTLAALLSAACLAPFALTAATPAAPATTAPAAAAAAKPADAADAVVVKAKGFEIKRSDIDFVVNSAKAEASARRQQIPPEELPNIELMAMEHLIDIQLLNGVATAAQKAKGKEEGDKRFEDLKKQAPSEEMLNMQLKAAGLTMETLRASMILNTTADAVVRDKVSVTDDQVKKFYDENLSKFEMPEQVKAAHILFATKDLKTQTDLTEDEKKTKKKTADAVLKKARAGEDFGKLVQEFTDDTLSKTNNGEYTFGKGDMMPEFEGAAFTMKTNQISDLVTTMYGYHIIKLISNLPSHVSPLSENKDKIKEYLGRLDARNIVPPYVAELKKAAGIEILDEKLKKLADEAAKAEAAEAAATNAPPVKLETTKPAPK